MTSLKLTYFDIQGAGEPSRLAAALNGVEYEDHRVNQAEWKELKASSKFGQLPMLEVNGEVFAQSNAILRFLGSSGSGKAYPSDPLFRLKVDQAAELAVEMGTTFSPCLYMFWKPSNYGLPEGYGETEEGKAKRTQVRQHFATVLLPPLLEKLEGLLSANGEKGWMASDAAYGPTVADCALIPRLQSFTAGFIDDIPTTVLDAHPALKDYVARFEALPEIQAHRARVQAQKDSKA